MVDWRKWFGLSSAPVLPVSPYQPPNDLVQITVESLFSDGAPPETITREIAQRVPGLKRALAAHCAVFGALPFKQQENGVNVDPQPEWLYRSKTLLMSPFHRNIAVMQDMFWWGWSMLGATAGDDGYPADAIHVPMGSWAVDEDSGEITFADSIPLAYRAIKIAIPLGLSGVLTDGIETIRGARAIGKAYVDRIENPIPQTTLKVTDADLELSWKQKKKLAEEYNKGRQLPGGSTSVIPGNVEVDHPGTVSADLFESGRNASRLDLANHALVPASLIEGAKSGSSGDMNYTNESTKRNELYDFGTSLFVRAYEARLSMDDVCPPGQSIRADLTNVMTVPTPAQNAPSED